MFNIFQQTISNKIEFEGIGLHSGKTSKVRLLPASSNSGIIFKRVDLKENNIIKANYSNVSSAILCTTLENDNSCKVSTVEHLLAAFFIKGIDNVIIEINNEEVPIMDGSSKNFLKLIDEAGIEKLNTKKKYLRVLKELSLKQDDKKISVEPYRSLEINFELDYKNKIIGNQANTIDFSKDSSEEISSSRTFCLYEDVEKIKKFGLAKGGSLENAVVVDDEKVINKEGLRNEKEFVNHKILDLAGDFLLSGHRVIGKVICYQGGHELTNLFLRKIFKTKDGFELIELDNIKISKKLHTKEFEKVAINA